MLSPSAADPRITPTRGQLFTGFFKTGLSGFGGVLPHARRMLVDDRRWLTDPQFTELLSLGQTLPGPNVLNMAVVIGARFHGWQGSVIAAFGLMTAPLVIVLSLASLYGHFAHSVRLAQVLAAVAAAAAGLVLATGGRLAAKMARDGGSILVLVAAFLAVFWLRLPLLIILAVLAPISIAFGWHSLRQELQARQEGPSS
ncbi:MAG TPA: chromate transporter [Geothrix sp.]